MASLEDLQLLLQKERVVFSITSTSRDICYYFYSTRSRSKGGQHPVGQWSVSGQSAVGQQSVSSRSTDDRPTSFSFLLKVPYVHTQHMHITIYYMHPHIHTCMRAYTYICIIHTSIHSLSYNNTNTTQMRTQKLNVCCTWHGSQV